MDDKRFELAKRMIARAQTGLYFLDACLEKIHRGGTDVAYSRSIYILLSFNFELLLKARAVLAAKNLMEGDLMSDLRHHNLSELFKILQDKSADDLGIQSVDRTNGRFVEYQVVMNDGCHINIPEFINVRYDFEQDDLRDPDHQESQRIKKEVRRFLDITEKIIAMIPEEYWRKRVLLQDAR